MAIGVTFLDIIIGIINLFTDLLFLAHRDLAVSFITRLKGRVNSFKFVALRLIIRWFSNCIYISFFLISKALCALHYY